MEIKTPADKRITVKLDAKTYRQLRQYGLDEGQSNQAIMVCALKEYLARVSA